MNNTDRNPHQEFRRDFIDFLRKEIVGPARENEILEEGLNPVQRYSAGILFPQVTDEASLETTASETLDNRSRDEEDAGTIEQSTSFFPSAMGISFAIDEKVKQLSVIVEFAKYRRVEAEDYKDISYYYPGLPGEYMATDIFQQKFEYEDGYLRLKSELLRPEADMITARFSNDKTLSRALWKIQSLQRGWKRVPVEQTIPIELKNNAKYSIEKESLQVVVVCRPAPAGRKLCTVTLVNTAETGKSPNDHKLCYLQTKLTIHATDSQPVFEDLGQSEFMSRDEEEQSLKLLYSHKYFFATGHGTSAAWQSEGATATEISTESLPQHIVPQVSVDVTNDGQSVDMRMANIAYGRKEAVLNDIEQLVDAYKSWIKSTTLTADNLPDKLKRVAAKHMQLCREAAERMEAGIAVLQSDGKAWEAFRLANEAMVMQRAHTIVQSTKQFAETANKLPDSYDDRESENPSSWRAFQLAFLLMGVEAGANKGSNFKNIVDLIWFPTGGGKTEAYLGLTAFTIFYRRLTNDDSVSGGCTVLMRYTLRLLTSQQFQRACTLICACEKLRRQRTELGTAQISIGLWLGGNSTPNSMKNAEIRLTQLQTQSDASTNNPFQVLSCPWCGTHMIKKEGRGVNGYLIKARPSRFVMWCPNRSCDYKDELPIHLVDDDIYRFSPTLLFGTVDKFAQLPWKAEAARIFALDAGNQTLSPELIIQDELHLISGSLGTMVGIYEAAIDVLCSAKGNKPRIIASTATIRRAKQQCNALYARDVRQFPSPGIDAADSFFAKEAPVTSKTPGRLYLGVMPSGKTSTTMQVRLKASCIQAPEFMDYPDSIKDKYWTQVVYCNSIRELGTSKSIIYDDVKEYSSALAERNHKKVRTYSDRDVEELTSRISADLIPEILQRLTVEYPDKQTIDALLATNMISVGVDVDRLGLMLILGQPKTTSEYIQASSRVGRRYPGLVITLYSPVKSRDRSHYEQFKKYHQSLYRYVEPTSVTPFSAPVRDKALHAVLITLIRHFAGLEQSSDLAKFDASSPEIRKIVEEIIARIKIIDPSEENASRSQIERILAVIGDVSELGSVAMYGPSNSKDKTALMRYPAGKEYEGRFSTPQSMRNTDVEVAVRLDASA